MTTTLSEAWLQEVVASTGLSPVSPEVAHTILPLIEQQLAAVLQQAIKFQKRSKSSILKVDHLNLSLTANKQEPIYGLHLTNENLGSSRTVYGSTELISLVDLVRRPSPQIPLKPSLALHWLAVLGEQPLIPQNPCIVSKETIKQPLSLPQEMQNLYARITGIILNYDNPVSLSTVFRVLGQDTGLQELVPYFSHFFYTQVKANTRRLPLLLVIINCIKLLHENSTISLEAHLPQLLPTIFTCIVSSKLSSSYTEDHWSLRKRAAELISQLNIKYASVFPDLHTRICKTFVEAITQSTRQKIASTSSLPTLFGGVTGLATLGPSVVRALLLPQLSNLTNLLRDSDNKSLTDGTKTPLDSEREAERQLSLGMCREAIKSALGNYMVSQMKLASLPWDEPKKMPTFDSMDLCDLEEALVPDFSVHSKDLYHCRLML